MKIAGVARDDVKEELLELMLEEDLPTLSQAVGAALGQWLADRRRRRSGHPGRNGNGASQGRDGVLHPTPSVQNPSSPPEGDR